MPEKRTRESYLAEGVRQKRRERERESYHLAEIVRQIEKTKLKEQERGLRIALVTVT